MDKKPTKNARKKKLVGLASEYQTTPPISVERGEVDGTRLTKLIFPEPFPSPRTIPVDEVFAKAIIDPIMLVNPEWWYVIKPWLLNTSEEINAFWNSFNQPEAIQERLWCTEGDKFVTWRNERIILQMARKTRKIQTGDIQKSPSITADIIELNFVNKLAEWVMDAVHEDPTSLRRLQTLINKPDAASDKTNRERTNRSVLEAFLTSVALHQKLPTKKTVREDSFISSDENGRSVAWRALSELGLNGLPEAK
jgi:hypothetical protein